MPPLQKHTKAQTPVKQTLGRKKVTGCTHSAAGSVDPTQQEASQGPECPQEECEQPIVVGHSFN